MRYVVKVNGKEYDVEVEKLGGPYQSLTRGTAYAQAPAYAPMPAPAPVAQPAPTPTPTPAPAAPTPAPAPASSGGANDITSPMPGKVFKLLSNVGDSVTEGQAVMILEAMKMENEIVATSSGVIDAILVKEGDMVDTDDVLVKLK